MKKDYQKPLLFAEQFALNEHISKGCGVLTTFGGDCPIQVDNDPTFFTATPACHPDAISMLKFAGYDGSQDPVRFLIEVVKPTCYNSFADYSQLFIS